MNRCILSSIPKSGTHLMLHILDLDDIHFARQDRSFGFEPAGFAVVQQRMRVYENGCMSGHIVYCMGARQLMDEGVFIFLYRHPGDIVTSAMYWTQSGKSSFAHLAYAPIKITAAKDYLSWLLYNWRYLIAAFLGWLDEDIHKIRYEDLLSRPADVLAPVAEDLGVPLEELVERSKFRGGTTYRKAQPGNWKEEITGHYREYFEEHYSGLVKRMGYEL